MISELKDEEILDFLMNSDFDGDYSPDELKYLLLKWRYFYRSIHSSMGRVKDDNNAEIDKLKEEVSLLKNQVSQLQIKNLKDDETISNLKKRKLSIKERISGKINFNEDENSGLPKA